jgi:excisionase family DNA binding protein
MNNTIPQRLMSKEDLAEYLNISVAQVDRLRGMGALKYVLVGAQVRFRPEDISAYLEANTKSASAQNAEPQTEEKAA